MCDPRLFYLPKLSQRRRRNYLTLPRGDTAEVPPHRRILHLGHQFPIRICFLSPHETASATKHIVQERASQPEPQRGVGLSPWIPEPIQAMNSGRGPTQPDIWVEK